MVKVPLISDFMTRQPMTVSATQPVRTAKLLMTAHQFRHLPVVDKGKLVGILSDRDVKLAQAISKDPNFDESVLISDICQPQPYVVPATTRADIVLAHMWKERIGSALVTEGGKLAGIFTVTDACRAFADFIRMHCTTGSGDSGE